MKFFFPYATFFGFYFYFLLLAKFSEKNPIKQIPYIKNFGLNEMNNWGKWSEPIFSSVTPHAKDAKMFGEARVRPICEKIPTLV